MEATFWSAGKDGRTAKIHIFMHCMLIILWIAALVSIAFGTSYFDINGNDLGAFSMVCMLLFFSIITFFIPFISFNMVKLSYRALKRNTKFTIKIISNEERSNINIRNIVYGDKYGVVLSNDMQAYDDWTLFYRFDSINDFYIAKDKIGIA